eukprot:351948-Chlamydomonas_euryale.AAC.6
MGKCEWGQQAGEGPRSCLAPALLILHTCRTVWATRIRWSLELELLYSCRAVWATRVQCSLKLRGPESGLRES